MSDYFTPNTALFLFEGVPIDASYEHTFWWDKSGDTEEAKANQVATFANTYKHYDFAEQYYQRYEKGSLRVNMLSDDIMQCNYMIFTNNSFSTRNYFAFITQIEYSANNVATIYYDIDYIQTFYFDFRLLPCFIEREHDAFDEMYANLISENLDLGTNYVQTGAVQTFDMNKQGWCLIASCDENGDTGGDALAHFKFADNMAVCSNVYAEDFDAIQFDESGDITRSGKQVGFFNNGYFIYWYYTITGSTIANILDNIITRGKLENILALYQYPTTFGTITEQDEKDGVNTKISMGITKTQPIYRYDTGHTVEDGTTIHNQNGLDGYIPKNNKMYTYPFTFLKGSNNLGDTKKYYWEDFDYDNENANYVTFSFNLAFYPGATVLAYPMNHRGISNDYDEGLVYDKFPQVPFAYDGWTVWWGNNAHQTSLSIGSSLLHAGTAYQTGEMQENVYEQIKGVGERNLVSGLTNTASNVFNLVGKRLDMEDSMPASNFSNEEQMNLVIGKCQYSFYCMTIRHQQAEIIDQYFTRYGYATHKVKVPNTCARENWTYVKTVGCTLNGNLPADARKAIEGIFNNGITFWKNMNEVGNYNLDNSCTGIEGEGGVSM